MPDALQANPDGLERLVRIYRRFSERISAFACKRNTSYSGHSVYGISDAIEKLITIGQGTYGDPFGNSDCRAEFFSWRL